GEENIDSHREEWINSVHVIRWPVQAPGGAYHIPRMRGKLKKLLQDLAKGCDAVHFHSVHSVLTMYSLSVLRGCSVRKVLTPHYHGTGHTAFRRLLWVAWRSFVRKAIQHVDVVHAVSLTEAQRIARDFHAKPLKIEHGVEEWLLNVPWNPSNYVMYSGRIEKYKNVHRLARIVKILNEMGLDLELKVLGDGPFKRKLAEHLDKLGIEYELKPPQPYEEYVNYLSRAALFGLLSEREAFGQTVNEANAIGVPAVVAEPWGVNFSDRSRTLIIRLEESDASLAQKIAAFLYEVKNQPKSSVPSWDRVVEAYVRRLYVSE
ncbi:MAG: glycosyltransferase, partial [Crenarchaeota archaeon]|nr:glycosyltransferase [Thermoproteota archaeon]